MSSGQYYMSTGRMLLWIVAVAVSMWCLVLGANVLLILYRVNIFDVLGWV